KPTSAMRPGSDTPLASITIQSGCGLRSRTSISAASSPEPIEQQMQPLVRLMVCPSCRDIKRASMLMGPKSLTRTAMRRPLVVASRLLSSVVLPEPRKPLNTVSGMRLSLITSTSSCGHASEDGAQNLDIFERFGRLGQWIAIKDAEIGILANFDRAD